MEGQMQLREFFEKHSRVAVAFSGGVDSAYLLWASKEYAKEVKAYYVRSQFQPQFELEDAKRLADGLGAEMKIIELDVLGVPHIRENPHDRCYFCKSAIFGAIAEQAGKDGFDVLIDGTNASDDEADRPGTRALKELSVLSPLRICGLTKNEIRRLSREAGLFTWDKPAYACLATRIPEGEEITREKLEKTERAERYLASLGFTDIRVRSADGNARIQVPEEQLGMVIAQRERILDKLGEIYKTVSLDLEVRG